MTGTSPRASVSDTKVWQLAILPSVEQYCGATPTECLPFLSMVVSSMTSTASRPRRAYLPEPAVQSPPRLDPRPQPRQNGAIDRNHWAQPARPLAECSCGHQDRSAPTRRPGTSGVASYRPTNPETALASVLDHSSNRASPQSWSAPQKPTTHESLKN